MISWFKVELDQKTGKILKTTRVAAAEKDGRFVRYVEAAKKQDANDLALRWYVRCQKARERMAERRQAHIVAGRCIANGCYTLAQPGATLCAACAVKSSLRSKARRLRHRAGDFSDHRYDYTRSAAQKELDHAKSTVRNQMVARRSQRLTVLRDVRAALFANRDLKAFTSWLNKRIKEEEKHVAALPPIGSRAFGPRLVVGTSGRVVRARSAA